VNFDDLRRALNAPLPGFDAQKQMIPRPRPGTLPPPIPEQVRKEASVLILLYPKNDAWHFVLTKRTDAVETHKGQVSLPGGARESGESLAETAVRETREELGLDADAIEILGHLTPIYIPVSDFWVTPFVGATNHRPNFHPAPDEVVELLHVPVEMLLDPSIVREEDWEIRGQTVRVPYYALLGHKVWGATAMMLSEWGEILKQVDR
jgi:8-oxo-dGTP pyrophosphatase MutT (NUDIX family)